MHNFINYSIQLLHVTRGQGKHLKKGETKQKIIEYILSSPTLFVGEPEMRDYLKKNHDIREAKNIKRLLNDLAKQNLITKQEQRGFENKWGCDNIKQIQNIFEEYKDILTTLQKNEKIISMLNEKYLKQEYIYNLDTFWDFYRVVSNCKKCKKKCGNYCKSNELDRLKCYDFKFQYIPSYFEDTPVICTYLNELKTSQNRSNYLFKQSLIFEPPFFKMHLIKTSEELKEILEVLEQNHEIVTNVIIKFCSKRSYSGYELHAYWDFYDVFKLFKDTIKSINLFN